MQTIKAVVGGVIRTALGQWVQCINSALEINITPTKITMLSLVTIYRTLFEMKMCQNRVQLCRYCN